LVELALAKLTALGLVSLVPGGAAPLPALARYAVGETVVKESPRKAQRP
jgi:hypothetical protein